MNKTLASLGSGILLAVAAVMLAGALMAKPANTQINLAPSTATLTADNHSIHSGNIYLAPGKHSITATLKDFVTVKTTVDVPASKATSLDIILDPANENGSVYLDKHPDLQLEREAIGGKQYSNNTSAQERVNPIIHLLPWEGLGYVINYGQSTTSPNDPTKISLVITSDDAAAQQRALNWITYSGYNAKDYDISTNYSSQLD